MQIVRTFIITALSQARCDGLIPCFILNDLLCRVQIAGVFVFVQGMYSANSF